MGMPHAIPLRALLDAFRDPPGPVSGDEAAPLDRLRQAHLIYALHHDVDRETLVYGAAMLDQPLPIGWCWSSAVVRVALGPDPGDFARLLAIVADVRGKHDYRAESEPPDVRIDAAALQGDPALGPATWEV